VQPDELAFAFAAAFRECSSVPAPSTLPLTGEEESIPLFLADLTTRQRRSRWLLCIRFLSPRSGLGISENDPNLPVDLLDSGRSTFEERFGRSAPSLAVASTQ
jgi:hypothetical protein